MIIDDRDNINNDNIHDYGYIHKTTIMLMMMK